MSTRCRCGLSDRQFVFDVNGGLEIGVAQETDCSIKVCCMPKKTPARLITLWESLFPALCRDVHVLFHTDAELDLYFVVVPDLDAFHQTGDDHMLFFIAGLIKSICP